MRVSVLISFLYNNIYPFYKKNATMKKNKNKGINVPYNIYILVSLLVCVCLKKDFPETHC